MKTANTTPKVRKSPMLAAILNLIPLLGLASCYTNQVDKTSAPPFGILWFAWFFWSFVVFLIFAWGLGYAYLGRPVRWFLAVITPWVLCPLAFFIRPWDVEHSYRPENQPTTENFVPILIVVGSAIIITTIDALRLASRHNAELNAGPKAAPPDGEANYYGHLLD